MFFHQPTNATSMEDAEATPLNMMDMLDALKESCPVESEMSIQERLDELEKIREAKRPKGRQVKGDVSEFPYFFYECGDRIVPNPKKASEVSDRWRYRRVPKSASGARPPPLNMAPRYRGNAQVPTFYERRSKTANMGSTHGAKDSGMRPPVGMHPYNRVDKQVGTERKRHGKGGKPPAHLDGVPAELLAHDPTLPPPRVPIMHPPTPSDKSHAYRPTKKSILKSSPSPRSAHKSKAPSPEDVEASKRHAEKKKNAAQKRVTFWLNMMHGSPPKYEPPVLPAPVMRGYAAFQQASELAAGLAGLSIAARS